MALAIGISDYLYLPPPVGGDILPDIPTSGDLYAPVYDKADFVAFLRSQGVSSSNIVQLSESAATKANVINAFTQLDEKENENTTVIFFYSGHGGPVPDDNGDEPDGWDEFIAMYEVKPVSGSYVGVLTDDELQALLANLESRHIIVILDSCYSGGMIGTAGLSRGGDLLRRGLPKPMGGVPGQGDVSAMADLAQPGRLILTAGTGDQSAWESRSLQNGVFTYFYLQALQDALHDANRNGRISAEEAYWFSRDLVDDWVSANDDEHQNPDISDKLFGQVDLTWLP